MGQWGAQEMPQCQCAMKPRIGYTHDSTHGYPRVYPHVYPYTRLHPRLPHVSMPADMAASLKQEQSNEKVKSWWSEVT